MVSVDAQNPYITLPTQGVLTSVLRRILVNLIFSPAFPMVVTGTLDWQDPDQLSRALKRLRMQIIASVISLPEKENELSKATQLYTENIKETNPSFVGFSADIKDPWHLMYSEEEEILFCAFNKRSSSTPPHPVIYCEIALQTGIINFLREATVQGLCDGFERKRTVCKPGTPRKLSRRFDNQPNLKRPGDIGNTSQEMYAIRRLLIISQR